MLLIILILTEEELHYRVELPFLLQVMMVLPVNGIQVVIQVHFP